MSDQGEEPNLSALQAQKSGVSAKSKSATSKRDESKCTESANLSIADDLLDDQAPPPEEKKEEESNGEIVRVQPKDPDALNQEDLEIRDRVKGLGAKEKEQYN